MIRKQIVIEPEQDRRLADLAKERGVSQSQLIRNAIAEYVGRLDTEAGRDQAFERLMDRFRNAPDLGLTDEHGNRTWTREGLYEDPLRRH
jgi:predicted transcriptional regulator